MEPVNPHGLPETVLWTLKALASYLEHNNDAQPTFALGATDVEKSVRPWPWFSTLYTLRFNIASPFTTRDLDRLHGMTTRDTFCGFEIEACDEPGRLVLVVKIYGRSQQLGG